MEDTTASMAASSVVKLILPAEYALRFIGITILINTEIVAMLLTTASVAHLAEHRTSF